MRLIDADELYEDLANNLSSIMGGWIRRRSNRYIHYHR